MKSRTLSLLFSLLLLVLMPGVWCMGVCDCDGDGIAPTVLDALTAAQLAAGTLTPTALQARACDADASGGASILDALLLAQGAAGLPVTLSCPSGAPSSSVTIPLSAVALAPGRNLVRVDVDDPDSDPLTVTLELSADGGASWSVLALDPASTHANPAVAVPSPSTLDFLVDMTAIAPLQLEPIELRVTVDDGTTTTTGSLATWLNTITPEPTGSSVLFLLDHSAQMGWGAMSRPGRPIATPWQVVQWATVESIGLLAPSESFSVAKANGMYDPWGSMVAATAPNRDAAAAFVLSGCGGGCFVIDTALAAALATPGGPPARLVVLAGPIDARHAVSLPLPYPSTKVDVIQVSGATPEPFWQDLASQNGGSFQHWQ